MFPLSLAILKNEEETPLFTGVTPTTTEALKEMVSMLYTSRK
jgi:hypothetical protein